MKLMSFDWECSECGSSRSNSSGSGYVLKYLRNRFYSYALSVLWAAEGSFRSMPLWSGTEILETQKHLVACGMPVSTISRLC